MTRFKPIRNKSRRRGRSQDSSGVEDKGKRNANAKGRGKRGEEHHSSRSARGGSGAVYAAIDLGTNNCRLLVARPCPDGFRVIDAFSRIVRLGEGLTRNGRLSEAAMNRTVDALKVCAAKVRRRKATRIRAVATEACRRAENCPQFLQNVRAETGIELEIISSNEEARLALHGCAQLLDPNVRHALVFDIGGGSTELSWLEIPSATSGQGIGAKSRLLAEEARLIAWHSIPKGVVSLAERYGGHSVTPALYETMVEEMREAIQPFETEHALGRALERGHIQMLGTSGTVTTLAGVHQNLPRYDRAAVDGCYMGFDTVRAVSERIATMSYDERADHPCIGRERADLVVAGCAILEALCRTWPVGRLRVADRGLREGILHNLMREDRHNPDAPNHAGRTGHDKPAAAR